MRTQRLVNFLRLSRPEYRGPKGHRQLGFICLIIATHQSDHRLVLGNENQRLDLRLSRHVVGSSGKIFNGLNIRGGEFFDGARTFTRSGGQRPLTTGLFYIGTIAPVLGVRHFAFTGLRRNHEFMRMIAAHDPSIRFHRKRLDAASLENTYVGIIHFLITN